MEAGSVFKQFFTAEDIAEPLASVTAGEEEKLRWYFDELNYDVIGFHERGEVIGFLKKEDKHDPFDLKRSMHRFEISDLITKNTDLLECLELLLVRKHLFVIHKSGVEAIITLADIQKPAVRMLFFGVVTVFESRLSDLINFAHPENAWLELLNEKRMEKARGMYEKLRSSNQEMNLITCTQLSDKMGILLQDPKLLSTYVGTSKTQANKLFNRTGRLRDDLAHAQSLSVWFLEKEVIGLIEQLLTITAKINEALKHTK